jgi:ethanolamine ammonia-lyase small subunit
MDSSRNCISNIRPGGLPPEEAATQTIEVIEQAFAHEMTGVRLNDVRAVATGVPVVTHRL